jgi:two-component system chemotaxis sensor kinase CheA
MSNEHDFMIQLMETFRTESRGHRHTIISALSDLEQGAGAERSADLVEDSLRAAHTLKGAARAVNKGQIADLCQSLEGIFSVMKKRQRRPEKKMFGPLYEAVDLIEKLEAGSGDGDFELNARLNDLRGALDVPGKEVPDG